MGIVGKVALEKNLNCKGNLCLKLAKATNVFWLGSKTFFSGQHLRVVGHRPDPYPMRRPLPKNCSSIMHIKLSHQGSSILSHFGCNG